MPNIDLCLDLRELINLGALAQDQEAAINAFLDASAFADAHRLYVGSSFCAQALLHSRGLIEAALKVCRDRGMSATLSVPIAAQDNLARQMGEVQQLLELGEGVIDEVIANDHGMLGWLCNAAAGATITGGALQGTRQSEQPQSFSVVVGRLLSKDPRDPRDPEYPWLPYEPALLQAGLDGGSFFDRLLSTWSFWDEEHAEYRCPIAGLELDPTHEVFLLGNLPSQITPAINGPLCYMSTGQICEYASMGLPDERLFRPNNPCAHQCTDNAIRYQGASGVEFAKLGRMVCFRPEWQCAPQGVDRYRQLVTPLWEVRC